MDQVEILPSTGCPSWCAGLHSPAGEAVLGRICERVIASRGGVIVALNLEAGGEPAVALFAPDLDAYVAMSADLARQMLAILEISGGESWLSESLREALALL